MSEEQAVEYVIEERDLNLEPEKFHVIKQVFRVLIGIPASLIIKIKECIKTRKQRKAEKKAIKAEKKARRLRWRKAIVQRTKSRFSKFALCSKNFKHQWAMAGMTEEEKEEYKINHGLVELEQKIENPVPQPTSVSSRPEEPAQSAPVIGAATTEKAKSDIPAGTQSAYAGYLEWRARMAKEGSTDKAPEEVRMETPAVGQESYASYLESSKTISVINDQIRTELAKGSEADFDLIGQYREQLRAEEMQRDNCLEAHILKCKGEPKKGVETVQAPAEEVTSKVTEKYIPRLSLGFATQRVARRNALIARGPKGIVTTMKCNVAQARKEAVIRAREIIQRAQELGRQVLTPVDPDYEPAKGGKAL